MSYFKENSNTRRSQSSWQKWLPVIAGIVLIGFFGSMMWSAGKYSNSAVIQQYYLPTANENLDPTVIGQVTEVNPKYVEDRFFAAETYFHNNNFTKAIEAYDIVLMHKDNRVYDRSKVNFETAHWNRILMLLGKGDRTVALDELGKIASSDFSERMKNDAKELKNLLNSFWYGWAN